MALLALRLCIGWHFYKEGVAKVGDESWTAAGFLEAARGPFADQYRALVWDRDGSFRRDRGRTEATWKMYIDGAAEHFGFDEEQRKASDEILRRHVAQLVWVQQENAEELAEYELEQGRIDALRSDPTREGVASLRGQREEIVSKWEKKRDATLTQIDLVWENLERAINRLATEPQMESQGYYYLQRPRLARIDTSVIDDIIPYFDIAIGLCLLVGLLVRPVAIVAALFLFSVVLSQFPGYPGTQPTYNQAVEACGLLVLAGVGAGRIAGLDGIFYSWWQRRKAKKQGES